MGKFGQSLGYSVPRPAYGKKSVKDPKQEFLTGDYQFLELVINWSSQQLSFRMIFM
jgi:hypothetical protein